MVNTNDTRPLYLQLADTLQKQIDETCSPDDKLPTEKELCDEYAVSRTTVRLAMAELEKRGSIYRVQGKGSFVATSTPGGFNTLLGYDFAAHCEHVEPDMVSAEVLELTHSVTNMSILQLFGSKRRNSIVKVEQRYHLDGQAIALESLYLSTLHVSEDKLIDSNSVARTLYGMRTSVGSVRERYTARTLTELEQSKLGTDNLFVLVVTRYVYAKSGELLAVIDRKILSEQMAYQNFVFTETE